MLLHAWVCWAGPQAVLPLWPEGVPGNIVNQDMEQRYSNEDGSVGYVRVRIPTLEVYMPVQPQEVQQAVVVCPGGGYGGLAYSHEGLWIAEQLNRMGIVAAVLKYRLPDDRVMTERHKRPLQDAQRALQIMHEHASDWDIDPNQIGLMGFSAGGHLAATVSTHFKDVLVEGGTVEQVKPDFSILVYPVIFMTEALTHQGSRNKLIGHDAAATVGYSDQLVDQM
jgi:acetyl esterase/lipase